MGAVAGTYPSGTGGLPKGVGFPSDGLAFSGAGADFSLDRSGLGSGSSSKEPDAESENLDSWSGFLSSFEDMLALKFGDLSDTEVMAVVRNWEVVGTLQ